MTIYSIVFKYANEDLYIAACGGFNQSGSLTMYDGTKVNEYRFETRNYGRSIVVYNNVTRVCVIDVTYNPNSNPVIVTYNKLDCPVVTWS